MELNANFSARVVVHGDTLDWQASPMPGVHRRMLDRIGGEIARATTIVRYAPNSKFSPHVHEGGEEFLVLDGVFEDEQGAYPKGAYVRNPPKSRHTPGSTPGCVMLVKLWQFDPADRTHVRLNVDKMESLLDSSRPGVSITPLYRDESETVRIEQWAPGVRVNVDAAGGAEVFVIAGGAMEGDASLRPYSWLRAPIGATPLFMAGPIGARVWIKTGHLRAARRPGF